MRLLTLITGIVLAFCCLFGCGKNVEESALPMDADEYDVVSSLIIELHVLNTNTTHKPLIILHDTTSVDFALFPDNDYRKLSKELSSAAIAFIKAWDHHTNNIFIKESVEDFLLKNKQEWNVQADAIQKRTAKMIAVMSQDVINKAFVSVQNNESQPSNSWYNFRKKYPTVKAIIQTSRVGFSCDKKYALLWMTDMSGELAGGAEFWVLEKRDGKWKIKIDCDFFGRKIVF